MNKVYKVTFSLVSALGSGESMLAPMPYQVKAKEGELQISLPEKVREEHFCYYVCFLVYISFPIQKC